MRSRPSILVSLLLLLGLAAALSACGVKNDAGPRDIPESEQVDLVTPQEQGAGAATGTQRIYLIGPTTNAQGAVLQAVARTANDPEELMNALLSGANATELDQQYRSAIPVGTRLNSVSLSNATLRIDLSEDILQLSGSDLVDALAQIVHTAAEWPGVLQVRVLVNGAEQQWPVGDGTLQSTPLDVYDYPGRVASSQPAYPAIPSPPPAGG